MIADGYLSCSRLPSNVVTRHNSQLRSSLHGFHQHVRQLLGCLGRNDLPHDSGLGDDHTLVIAVTTSKNDPLYYVGLHKKTVVGHRRHCRDHLQRSHSYPLPKGVSTQIGLIPVFATWLLEGPSHLAVQINAHGMPAAKTLQVSIERFFAQGGTDVGNPYVQGICQDVCHSDQAMGMTVGILDNGPSHFYFAAIVESAIRRDDSCIEARGHSDDLEDGPRLVLPTYRRVDV